MDILYFLPRDLINGAKVEMSNVCISRNDKCVCNYVWVSAYDNYINKKVVIIIF